MAVIGGLAGLVNSDGSIVGSTQKWSIDYSGEPAAYVASSTKKGTVRLAGNKDWTGKWTALGAVPAVKPGETILFEGSLEGVAGFSSASAECMIDGTAIKWDIEGGGIMTHEVSFSANGALVIGTFSPAADTTLPPVNLTSLIAVALQESDALGSPSYSTILDVRTMDLNITRANNPYNSSTTDGQTKRVAGPWDAELSYSVYVTDPTTLFIPGTVKMLKVFINATLFWDLQYMRFGELGGIESDQSTGAIIGATQVCKMEGFTDISGTMVEGKIVDPNSVTWWP